MKKTIKVALAIVMTIVLTVACAAVAVYAANYTSDSDAVKAGAVCRIGAEGAGNYYTTIAEAVSEAKDDDVITVISNTTISSAIEIKKSLTITSGKNVNVECSVSNAFTVNTGTGGDDTTDVTVSGNLNITNNTTQTFQMINGDLEITGDVKVSATNDTVNMGGSGVVSKVSAKISGNAAVSCTNTANNNGALYVGTEGAKLTVAGGSVTASGTARAIRCKAKGSTITISGGTLSADVGTVFYQGNGGGTLNISGGTVKTTSGNQCLYLSNAANKLTVNMTGGALTAKGDNSLYISNDGSTNNAGVDVNISGGTITGKDGIVRVNGGSGHTVKISGGNIIAETKTVNCTKDNCKIEISGDANITATAENSPAIRVTGTGSELTISGGTVTANKQTVALQGTHTVNITNGTIIAKQEKAIVCESGSNTVVTNISDNAKIYAGKQALVASSGLTFNVSGGLIDVSNEYTPDDTSSQYAIVTNSGCVNITGGKFILGGTNDSAQILYHESTNVTGVTTVNGGLFINNNKVNKRLFGPGVNYKSGRILYGNNIDTVISGTVAPKTVKVAYGTAENVYYFYTRFAATDAEKAGTMADGAQVRLTKGTTGMRFTTTFNEIEGATYGTIIVPASYLANLDSFTLEALEAAGRNYLNIEAINGIDEPVDGKVTFRAAITNIDPTRYTTAFAAIAYAKVGDTYYYTAFDLEDNARTVDFVATEALDDLRETKEGDYQNAVEAYGTTRYSPYNATQRKVLESFVAVTLNVPRPTGAVLINSGNGAYQYYLADVDADAHTAYKTSLVEAGFVQSTENTLENNVYTTYTKGEQIVTLTYTPNTEEMRVIMESTDNTSLPEAEEYNATQDTVDTLVTQVGQWHDPDAIAEGEPNPTETREDKILEVLTGVEYATTYTSGMGYVIRLEDGRFIIVDGGYNTEIHADNLYNVLDEQAEGDIVIAAWIFTHAHYDHVGAFITFTDKYAGNVTVQRFIYNFPAEESSDFVGTATPNLREVKSAINKYDGAVTIIAHAGQSFDIANAEINVLFTYEMMQPHKLSYYNSCSMIFNVKVESSTILFLGDAGGDSSTGSPLKEMTDIYTSNTLSANIVQAAHHGIDTNTYTADFYGKVNASYVFVPCASQNVLVDGDYIRLNETSVYSKLSNATKYIAGSINTVLKLSDGTVTKNS